MAQPAESSDFLALPHRPSSDRTPWAAPVAGNEMQPAEVVQARLFAGILQAEFAELHRLAERMAGSPHQQPDIDSHPPSRDLLRIHARIDEVHRLLQALQGRFPQPPWDAQLQPD